MQSIRINAWKKQGFVCFMKKRTSVFDYTGRLIHGSTPKGSDLGYKDNRSCFADEVSGCSLVYIGGCFHLHIQIKKVL